MLHIIDGYWAQPNNYGYTVIRDAGRLNKNKLEYNRLYANSPSCVSAKYQRYPKKNYPEMDLMDKIEELELLEVE